MIKMRKWMAAVSIAVVVMLQSGLLFASNQPALRLFPTTVVENIRQTGETAKSMEAGLHDIINNLEQQITLFKESKCEGAKNDEGCADISRQMGETYKQMLDTMESRLPAMEQSVNITRDSLQKRIYSELGQKMTPRQLQKMIQANLNKEKRDKKHKKQGRLSEKFKQYYHMVAMAGGRAGESLAVVAAEIYLDTEEVSRLIALTQDEIGRAKLMIDLNQSYGSLTPEMISMVSSVKSILFGEQDDFAGAIPSPLANSKENFQSPLEF
jgi:hypothetical protein